MTASQTNNINKNNFRFSEHVWVSILLLIILYLIFNIIAVIITLILTPKDQSMSPIILTIALFICYGIYLFLLVPFILKLPNDKNNYNEYMIDIGLKNTRPILYLVLIGLSCYIIFMFCQIVASILYGQYSFSITRVTPPDSWNIITSINSGIYEEMLFRGLIITLLLKKYSELKSIIISAILFGLLHILNLFNVGNSITTADLFFSFGNVIWAFIIGLFYGFTFVKTKSVIPGIIVHYLGNTLLDLWVFMPNVSVEIEVFFGIIFNEGIIPTTLSILWVTYFVNHWLNSKEVKLKLRNG